MNHTKSHSKHSISKRYRFEVRQELITPVEVTACTEDEARDRVLKQDQRVIPFDTQYGDTRLVLRSVGED
jgi:hypothetical protein